MALALAATEFRYLDTQAGLMALALMCLYG